MISIEEGIVYYLTHFSGLTALISTRTYPLKLPQGCTLPALTYQRISTPRELTHDQQAGGLAMPRFQFTAYGTKFADAKAVINQVRAALNGYKGSFGTGTKTVKVWGSLSANEQDNYDPDSGLYWTMADYFIHHEE